MVYQWDFDADGHIDLNTLEPTAGWDYWGAAPEQATVRVFDAGAAQAAATVDIL